MFVVVNLFHQDIRRISSFDELNEGRLARFHRVMN